MLAQKIDEYWKTVVDIIQDGIMIVDRSGHIVSVNKAMEAITGYGREEVIGKPCSTLNCDICEIVREDREDQWCDLFKNGFVHLKKGIIRKKDGSLVHILKNASVLHDKDGNMIGAVETLTDVSEIMEKESQINAFRKELRSEDGFHGLIGSSTPMKKVFDLVSNAAHSDAPVIIYGESGTGKELVSRAIHRIGNRQQMPFVKVNCAALTESLLESELFGHVKGAYTGAHQDREGRFEIAQGGTAFLDEIGDLPPSTQIKLLRVLEEKVIERVGDNRPVSVDVRMVSATNKDLTALIKEGTFREDLYFRINVIPIMLPPLRERIEDIPLLSDAFFRKIRLKSGKNIEGISNAAMEMLISHAWPGNVRELKSAFEYAFVTCQESIIQPHHLPPSILHATNEATPVRQTTGKKEVSKRKELVDALERANGNQSMAARILGVSRVTVWNRMKKYGINLKKIATS